MIRNLTVSAVVSVLMGLFVVTYTSLVPEAVRTPMAAEQGQPSMDSSPEAQGLQLFRRVVRPLLESSCLRCHNPQEKKGGLDLSSRAAALRGGETGEAIVPGKPDESLLVRLVEVGEMPKDGAMIPPEQVAVLRRWIELGAPFEEEPLRYRPTAGPQMSSSSPSGAMTAPGAAMAMPAPSNSGSSMGSASMSPMSAGPNRMMMCPCMQMMMGGGMSGGSMASAPMSRRQVAATQQPVFNPRTPEQARQRAESYLRSLGNPNLKVGEVRETISSFEVQVVTKDGSLVNWLVIDKQDGRIRSVYPQ